MEKGRKSGLVCWAGWYRLFSLWDRQKKGGLSYWVGWDGWFSLWGSMRKEVYLRGMMGLIILFVGQDGLFWEG